MCAIALRSPSRESLSLSPELYNGEPTGRNVRWYGIQAEILNDGKSWRTEDATEPIEFWLLLTELKDQYYPEANSVTVCQYTPRLPCIPGYKNQPIFSRKVILINLIDKPQKLDRAYISAQFRAENQKVPLNDGDVVAQLIQCIRAIARQEQNCTSYSSGTKHPIWEYEKLWNQSEQLGVEVATLNAYVLLQNHASPEADQRIRRATG